MFDLHNQLDVIEKDVVYQHVDGVDWHCRIHMPAQPGKRPWPRAFAWLGRHVDAAVPIHPIDVLVDHVFFDHVQLVVQVKHGGLW